MVNRRINRNTAGGVSLIEVMVSLVVLTMGVLGMAALQGIGTGFGNKAYYRSQATAQAYDLMDRMRANPTAAAAGDYVVDPMPSSYGTDCATAACTTAQLATYDLVTWNAQNAALMPNGSGSATNTGTRFTVTVNWQEEHDGAAENKSVAVSSEL